jgi:hypothetical protein
VKLDHLVDAVNRLTDRKAESICGFRLMMDWYLPTRAQLLALMPAALIIGPHLSISD